MIGKFPTFRSWIRCSHQRVPVRRPFWDLERFFATTARDHLAMPDVEREAENAQVGARPARRHFVYLGDPVVACRFTRAFQRRLAIPAVATAILGGGLVIPVPAYAAETETIMTTIPTGGDWINYPLKPVVSGVLKLVSSAAQPDGSCLLELNMALAPSQSAVQADEVAFNPVTCQSVISFGMPTSPQSSSVAAASEPLNDVLANAGPLPATPDTFADAALPATPELTGPALASSSPYYVASTGTYKSYYEDPVQIDVNSVINHTNWSWRTDGKVCTYNVSGNRSYDWYSPSGWEMLENNWQNTYVCKESTSSSYVHFRNGRFCASVDTHNYYNRNVIHGRQDGWLIGQTTASKKGGCTALLSLHTSLKRTN